jgi:hypothetical protein
MMVKKNDINALPMKHQVGMLVVGTIVGFAAQQLTNKAYVSVLDCIKNKKLVTVTQ